MGTHTIVRFSASRCTQPRTFTAVRPITAFAVKAEGAVDTVAATYTHYGTNSFGITFNGCGAKLLVDPWLVGTLSFGEQTWLLESSKYLPEKLSDVLKDVNAILLSQSLDDHTHRPTLQVLPKWIPVVAEPGAAEIAREMGFKAVTSVDHGQQVQVSGPAGGAVSIKALPGALVGPPWSKRQNGWLMTCTTTMPDGSQKPFKVYTEPHASHSLSDLRREAPVDAIIVPVASSYVAGYPVVEGMENAKEVLQALQPSVLIPLDNADGKYEGVVAGAITSSGSNQVDSVQQWLAQQDLTQITAAGGPPGESVDIMV